MIVTGEGLKESLAEQTDETSGIESLTNHEAGGANTGRPKLPEGPLPDLDTEPLAQRIAELAAQAKAADIDVLRVYELVQYTDYFVIVSGRSDRHVASIRDHIQDGLAQEKIKPQSVEGTDHNQWVLIDYGSVVVHIFFEPVREFYELERLWGEAPRVETETETETDEDTRTTSS
ncbi:MAG: ribosome-associated protein [Myxococcota bacterium]